MPDSMTAHTLLLKMGLEVSSPRQPVAMVGLAKLNRVVVEPRRSAMTALETPTCHGKP